MARKNGRARSGVASSRFGFDAGSGTRGADPALGAVNAPVGLEVVYRLIPLVDRAQDGELLRRVRGIRKKIAQELGFLVPSVHIRDNMEIRPNEYRIMLKGVEVGQGEAFVGQYLAINPGRVLGTIQGTPTTDPAFGLPALWIEGALRDEAQ